MVKHKGFAMFVLVALLLNAALPLALAQEIVPADVSSMTISVRKVHATVNFSAPISIDEVVNWSERYSVHMTQLLHTYQVGSYAFGGGYFVDEYMSPQQIPNDYRRTLQSMYQDLSKETAKHFKGSVHLDESVKANLIARQNALAELLSDLMVGQTTIIAVEVLASQDGLSKIASLPLVASVVLATWPALDQNAEVLESPQAVLAGEWWPNSGHVSVQPSVNPDQRYVYQSFSWDSTRLNNLKSYPSVTYEPESWFNNYDGQLYLGNTVKSWSSDLPQSYLDTGFADGNKEKGYTVGTAKASDLTANRSYYTQIWTNLGNASSDTGKLNGQRGKRIPDWCYSTWCIFPQATTFLVPAWQVPVPGSMSWSN